MFKVSKNVDWLSITMNKSDNIPKWLIGSDIKRLERSPNRNYNTAWQGNTGCLILSHTEQPDVGKHVILSGDTLGVLRGEGHSDLDIAEFANGHRVSRMDIAVTAKNTNRYSEHLNARRIQKMALSGAMNSRLKLSKGVDSDGELETVYIGSRKSRNRILRVYDKGVELGGVANEIIRYELETRKNANGVARAIVEGMDIGGIIRRYVDFPNCKDWLSIMSAESVVMPQVDKNLTIDEKEQIERANRWHWLMTSVAPAMARALLMDEVEIEDNNNLRLFGLHVQNIYEELKNG